MKKYIHIVAIALFGAFILTGCTGTITQSARGTKFQLCAPNMSSSSDGNVYAHCQPTKQSKKKKKAVITGVNISEANLGLVR